MTNQRKQILPRVPRRLSALVLAGCFFIPGISARDMAARVLPIPDGYYSRASLMDAGDNPLGTIDQLSRFETLSGLGAELMLAKAYYRMGDARCVPILRDFIASNPASEQVQTARMLLGDFYFFSHDFANAVTVYEDLDVEWLSKPDAATYSYRKAFSLIKTGHFNRAVPLLSRLRDNSTYGRAAVFYLAYIDYVNGDYDKAYDGFAESLEMGGYDSSSSSSAGSRNMPRRGEYIPTGLEAGYYMLQIEFMRGQYDTVISGGTGLLKKTPVPELIPETRRIMGESYFKQGDLDNAAEYLNRYIEETQSEPTASAIYTLGVIDYENGDYESAAERFGQIGEEYEDISQSAYLYMGQCAIRQNEPDLAAIAFRKAYQMNYDPKVAETALYNYIASVTRGGKVPFASSVSLMQEFVDNYPDSKYAPEIEQYMAVAYYNEKDYANALKSINRISRPDAKVLAAKQKILFEYGVREMSNGNAEGAEEYLSEAMTLSRFDAKTGSQTALWLGDALYAQRKYGEAEKAYAQYLRNDKGGDNSTLGLYNMAYSLYMQDKFSSALAYFDDALSGKPKLPSNLSTDALVRKADCLYYLGRLNSAADVYSQAMKAGAAAADYAAMRRAVIAGVNGDNATKARLLGEMMETFPNSKWISTAMLEQALAYMETEDTDKAIKTLNNLSRKFPNSPETRTAMLQMALLYSKQGNETAADEAYKSVISKWPSSEEAQTASDELRRIYASRGELSQLADFLRRVPGAPQLDSSEVEQLTYDAAASEYAAGGSDRKLVQYVQSYPDGKYVAQALRDIAEYQFTDENRPDDALQTIETLLKKRPYAQQVPGALLLKAQILEEAYPNRTDEILSTYREVEKRGGSAYSAYAWAGIMRHTADAAERLEYARKVREAGGLDSDILDEARYYEAAGLLAEGSDVQEAVSTLKSLAESPQSLPGSRAAVALGEYYLGAKQYKKAIEVLSAFTDSGTPHEYWLARGYIALADAYRASGKKQLALEYIRSLKDNYPGDDQDIAEMINKRLKSWK